MSRGLVKHVKGVTEVVGLGHACVKSWVFREWDRLELTIKIDFFNASLKVTF